MTLPKVICSSVVRSAHQGESHGGLYIVDLESSAVKKVVDYNDKGINWQGRGGDRGLRGICVTKDLVYIAASDEIFIYDKKFRIQQTYKNEYLGHCHEIFLFKGSLFLTSTGFDSILEFDTSSGAFKKGYSFSYGPLKKIAMKICKKIHRKLEVPASLVPKMKVFDPNQTGGPRKSDVLHINNTFIDKGKIHFSGTGINSLFLLLNGSLSIAAKLPFGTHNVMPFKAGYLMNNTHKNQIIYASPRGKIIESFDIMKYKTKDLVRTELPNDHARQAFGRGLCVYGDLIIAGSSPATISVYQTGSSGSIKTITITKDVRHAIHGLEVWK